MTTENEAGEALRRSVTFLDAIETGARPAQLAAMRIVLKSRLEVAVGRDVAGIAKEWRTLLLELKPAKPADDLTVLRDRLAAELADCGPRDVPSLSRELRATILELEAVGVGQGESVSDRVAEQRRRRRAAPADVLPPAVDQ